MFNRRTVLATIAWTMVDVVNRLLSEKPAIAGIALPGMPAGAPGMGGEKSEPWTIYAFTKDGKVPAVFATV